jgi:hypothetical protein
MTNAGSDPYVDDDFDDAIAGRTSAAPRGRRFGAAENRLFEYAEDSKNSFLKNFDGLIALIRDVADRIDGSDGPIGSYVHRAAGMVEDLQASLRERPVEELLDEGRSLIRRSPEVALGVAVLAGFVAARLIKSTSGPA